MKIESLIVQGIPAKNNENGEILFEGTPELFFQGSGLKRIEGFISAMLPNK